MIKALAAVLAVAGLTLGPSASASVQSGVQLHAVHRPGLNARPPACTHPAVVNDGLIELTCFPVIPAKQFPAAGVKCSHIDSWVTGHSTETVNGQRYKITQKVRHDVWICKS